MIDQPVALKIMRKMLKKYHYSLEMALLEAESSDEEEVFKDDALSVLKRKVVIYNIIRHSEKH